MTKEIFELEVLFMNAGDVEVLDRIEIRYGVRDIDDPALMKHDRIIIDDDLESEFSGNALADYATAVQMVKAAEGIE